jgi:chromosome segregation ATPase
MPRNPPSDANDGSSAVSSKSSLLWAYQLRKEHIHLVNRIEDVNSDLLSCSSRATENHQNLSNLERLIKSLQTENYSLKNEVTIVRDRFTASLDQVNKQVAAAITNIREAKEEEESLARLKRDFDLMGLRVKELTQGMAELKMGMAGIEKNCECLAMRQTEFASWQAKMLPLQPKIPDAISMPKRTQPGIRSSLIVCLRYSKTVERVDGKDGKYFLNHDII